MRVGGSLELPLQPAVPEYDCHTTNSRNDYLGDLDPARPVAIAEVLTRQALDLS